jgi:hypothetical protein
VFYIGQELILALDKLFVKVLNTPFYLTSIYDWIPILKILEPFGVV